MSFLDEERSAAARDNAGDLERSLENLDRLSRSFGRSLTNALEGATIKGQSLSTVLQGLGGRLVDLSLRSAMRPLETMIGGALGNVMNSVMPFAKGGIPGGRIRPFASGGVVSSPTYFPMAQGNIGLMGEAGSEAILPLARGSDGRLGVRTGGGGNPVNITVNIATPDIAGFRQSEAQVAAALARAVARGQRGM